MNYYKIDFLEINKMTKEDIAEIESFISSSYYGNIFQTINWGFVCQSAMSCIPYLIIIKKINKILASLLFIEYPRTKHFVAEEGPVLIEDNYELFKIIYVLFKNFCRKKGARRIEFHIAPYYDFRRLFKTFSWRAVNEIINPSPVIWANLDNRLRRNIKRSIKNNVKIIKAQNPLDYSNHIRLNRLSITRGNCPLHITPLVKYSDKILKGIIQYLPKNHSVFLAKLDDTYIASTHWLFFGKRAYCHEVGLDYLFRKYCAPDYLMWHSFGYLQELGIKEIDLMGVNPSSTSDFKRKWSTCILPNKYFIWTRPDFYLSHLIANPDSIINSKSYFTSLINHLRLK